MSHTRPFRFGHFANSASRTEWAETARKAEAAGYSTLVVGDHLDGDFSPITALAAAASVTSTLRLGTYVLGNDFYNPVLLARDAASLDVLSDGRLELGLGTGWLATDYTQTGIALESPGVRISRFEEALQIITGALTQTPFTFTGRYYQVRDLEGIPKTIQQPRPPLLVGGGAKRTLSLAARTADIVSVNIRTTPEGGMDISSLTAAAAAQKVAWIREAAGERLETLELNILVPTVQVTDHPRRAAEERLRQGGVPPQLFSADDALESPSVLLGSVDQIVDTLIERRERYGFSYIANWAPVEEFAPVVARLVGR
jgi:probable F420-dependent oxidoreductase